MYLRPFYLFAAKVKWPDFDIISSFLLLKCQAKMYASLRVLAGGILNFSGTLLGELIFLAQGDVLGILVHFWGS